MPSFYEFYLDHLEDAKAANAVLADSSADAAEVRDAKYVSQVSAPYRQEVAKEGFELLFDTPEDLLKFMENRIAKMKEGPSKNQCAAIFQDIQKKAVQAMVNSRMELHKAIGEVKNFRKKVMKKGITQIVETLYDVETKITDKIDDLGNKIEETFSPDEEPKEEAVEEKKPEFFKEVFKNMEEDVEAAKLEAARKLVEEKANRKAERDFLIEQSVKKEEEGPAREAVDNITVSGLLASMQKYLGKPVKSEFEQIGDKLRLLCDKAKSIESRPNPSELDWNTYNSLLKETRELGEAYLENKEKEVLDDPEQAGSVKDLTIVVGMTRLVDRLKKEESLSDQAKIIMNESERALKILKTGRYDGLYEPGPEIEQRIEDKVKLVAHACMARNFRLDGYGDENALTKEKGDELAKDEAFRMIATKFDGSKLAEAIEDKKLPEIIKAARASIEAKNKAAKAAEENKDKENEKEPVKKGPVME